jgi:hypothetical protein
MPGGGHDLRQTCPPGPSVELPSMGAGIPVIEHDPVRLLRSPRRRDALPDIIDRTELSRLLSMPGREGVWGRVHPGNASVTSCCWRCSPTAVCATRSCSAWTGRTCEVSHHMAPASTRRVPTHQHAQHCRRHRWPQPRTIDGRRVRVVLRTASSSPATTVRVARSSGGRTCQGRPLRGRLRRGLTARP